ncbi:hypothetical protein V6N13_052688 [Hibiscus sabdariffa]|uniref:Uncharacterized protein n=1 Tax=Hibiscus sabdariffa TaxID=183260 RepID=A0ABR2Q524_9ROSI
MALFCLSSLSFISIPVQGCWVPLPQLHLYVLSQSSNRRHNFPLVGLGEGLKWNKSQEMAPDDKQFSAFSTTHFSIVTIVSKKKGKAAHESLEAHMSEEDEEETIFSHAIIICEDDDDSW